MTKSKWYFSIPVLLLLLVDQSFKFQIEFIQKVDAKSNKINYYENIRKKVYISIIVLIVIGFIHYAIRQYKEFGSKFSVVKLLLYSSCAPQPTK